ncbi:hypothetical protein AGMMS49546_23130 [Spirochaetia bacterium]|nr:hypothetical protein AGMMS49546_23130 [Spirochaetia bacterium]
MTSDALQFLKWQKKIWKWTSFFSDSYERSPVTMGIESSIPCKLFLQSFGSKNDDKCFYVIHGHEAGLFSNLQYVLSHIKIAERLNMIPVVDYKNLPNTYSIKSKIEGGGKNAWEYYFHQLTHYSLDEVYSSKNVCFCYGFWQQGNDAFDSNPDELQKIYDKYIKLDDHIHTEINTYFKELFEGKYVLGIHFRGWEQNITPGHPFCPTIKQMFICTDDILKQRRVDKIYLVTEEKSYFEAFDERYGDLLISTPYYRTNKMNGYKIHPEPRENHIYLLGKEIMIATYLLAKCNSLLYSSSNVPKAAIFLKNDNYDIRYYIDNGINSTNRLYSKFKYTIKKVLPQKFGGLPFRVNKF